MTKLPFNTNWTLQPIGEPAPPAPVTLPHDAMLAEPRRAESAGGTNTGWFLGRDYCYEKTFTPDPAWQGMEIGLDFEGVYHRAEVWLNGRQLTFFHNGYLPFRAELTEGLVWGAENHLRVIARNSDQPNSRWYSGAGIYRPVWLTLRPREHLLPGGIRVKTLDWKLPTIQVELEANAAGRAQVAILDGEETLYEAKITLEKKASLTIPLPGAKLWSPEDPRQYTCRVRFGAEEEQVLFGIRTVEVDARGGFRLNGKRIILRGACLHHDNGLLGAAAHPYAEERKVRLLQQAGYNAIRSSHNPCSQALLETCDRLGMLVVDEYADMWYIHKTRYDYAEILSQRWQEDLTILSRRDYNHPSVVMYSIGNEIAETGQERGIRLCGQMADHLRRIDHRPVTCGVNPFFNYLSALGFGVYSDENAEKEARRAEKRKGKPGKHRAVGSEFFNVMAGIAGSDFMKFGATLRGSDRKTRDAYALLDVAGYNYGIDRYEKDLVRYPDRVILGSETFCSDTYRFWEMAKAHPALIGDFVWAGIDYLGETGIGAWEYKSYAPDFSHGPGWLTAGSGRLDITGRPNGEAAYTQVAYELSPIRIGVVPADDYGKPHSPSAWKLTNTLESWSWAGCEGRKTRVEVYARGTRIRLELNGKVVGEKARKRDCRTAFVIPYEPGTLTAISLDGEGRELCRTSLKSAGPETRLTLEAEEQTIGREDLAYVRLKYTDDRGMGKPLARGEISVSVAGGDLLGLGNGCPYNERGYLTDRTDTYYGEALAILRPHGPGKITLTAASPYGGAWAEVVVEA